MHEAKHMAWLHLHGHKRHVMDKSNCSVAVAAAAASEAIVTSVTTVMDINTFLRVPSKSLRPFMAATTTYGVEDVDDVPHGDGFARFCPSSLLQYLYEAYFNYNVLTPVTQSFFKLQKCLSMF